MPNAALSAGKSGDDFAIRGLVSSCSVEDFSSISSIYEIGPGGVYSELLLGLLPSLAFFKLSLFYANDGPVGPALLDFVSPKNCPSGF